MQLRLSKTKSNLSKLSLWKRLRIALNLTRSSYILMSVFVAIVFLIIIVWWPLAEEYLNTLDPQRPWWTQFDWLLLGDFLVMSLLIMARADLRTDTLIVLVGLGGGLVIESWGTQSGLWRYYTAERPPLWIIPAWPIASLSIDRLVRLLCHAVTTWQSPINNQRLWIVMYWLTFAVFYGLMLFFVWPTVDKSLTLMSLGLCVFLIMTPTDHRLAVLTFAAGSGLGFWLELWGTTRACWTYYTLQTPPLFAVLAHGMAAVAFWRAGLLIKQLRPALDRSQRYSIPTDQYPS